MLDDPAAFAPLGRAARATIEEKYSLEVCIPPLADFLERVANRKGTEAQFMMEQSEGLGQCPPEPRSHAGFRAHDVVCVYGC